MLCRVMQMRSCEVCQHRDNKVNTVLDRDIDVKIDYHGDLIGSSAIR